MILYITVVIPATRLHSGKDQRALEKEMELDVLACIATGCDITKKQELNSTIYSAL